MLSRDPLISKFHFRDTGDQAITWAQHHFHVLEIQVVSSYRHLLGFCLSPRNPLDIQLQHREELGEQ